MAEPFIGEIRMFAGNFAPRNWAFCNGAILPIASNTTLFSLLGTTYGGDGRVNFALPDLRGRAPIGTGRHPGSQFDWRLGQQAGQELHTLTPQELASHSHTATFTATGGSAPTVDIDVTSADATLSDPTDNILAVQKSGRDALNIYAPASAKNGTLGGVNVAGGGGGGGTVTVDATGSSTQFALMQPILVVNFIIAMDGIYPPRS